MWVMTWLSAYVVVGCLIAIISLTSSRPEKLSPLVFVLAHALWPASLIVIMFSAFASARRHH
jgi:hypothetical protein